MFVLDFYCPELRLGIEVDGGHHYQPAIAAKDARRSEWLKHFRVTIVRFSNAHVMNNREGVLERLGEVIAGLEKQRRNHPRPSATPSPPPLPAAAGCPP